MLPFTFDIIQFFSFFLSFGLLMAGYPYACYRQCIPCLQCQACTTSLQWQIDFGGSISDGDCSECADFLTTTYLTTLYDSTTSAHSGDPEQCRWLLASGTCDNEAESSSIELFLLDFGTPNWLLRVNVGVLDGEIEETITLLVDCHASENFGGGTMTNIGSPLACDWSSVTVTVTPTP